MAKTLVSSVVFQLQQERTRLEHELHRITVALTAFGKAYRAGPSARSAGSTAGGTKKHKISAEGRKRIAAAQRARWAKARASKKK